MSPAALGQAIAAALGIAVSPVAIATIILLMLSPRARPSSLGFLLGWSFGIAAAVTAFTLFAVVVPLQAPGAARAALGIVELVVGVVLLALGAAQWHRRHAASTPVHTPRWMRAIDRVTLPIAFALGCVMAINPPNLLLSLSGGLAIGVSDLGSGGTVAAIAVFTVVAASTVLIPFVAYSIARGRVQGSLDSFRGWLTRHNSGILTAVFAGVGILSVGQGIAALSAG